MNVSEDESEYKVETRVDEKKVNRAIAYACRLLGVSEYSQKLLQQKLKSKQYNKLEITQTIEYLLQNNWLSDQRYCEGFVRSRILRGQGLSRIQYELAQRGIAQPLVDQVLSGMQVDWQKSCNDAAKRKIRAAALKAELNDQQKLNRFLRYRGFSGEQIRRSINQYLTKKQDDNSWE